MDALNEENDRKLQLRRSRLMKEANWNDLMIRDKIRLLDIWSIISLFANVCQIIGCVYSIFRNNLNIITADKTLGLGCMLAWIVMLRYMMKTETYKAMIASFYRAAPFVGRAIISIIPVFIAYAFLGMAIFWPSRRFAYFGVSCYTLFALLHGDMIWDTYNDMMQVHYAYAQFYLFSYLFVSICVIANIFTIIIEEGFMKQKYDSDYSWLLSHTKKHMGQDEDSSKPDSGLDP